MGFFLLNILLGGGFKYFLFSPLFGEDFQFDSYFSDGLKPPTSLEFLEDDQRLFSSMIWIQLKDSSSLLGVLAVRDLHGTNDTSC